MLLPDVYLPAYPAQYVTFDAYPWNPTPPASRLIVGTFDCSPILFGTPDNSPVIVGTPDVDTI